MISKTPTATRSADLMAWLLDDQPGLLVAVPDQFRAWLDGEPPMRGWMRIRSQSAETKSRIKIKEESTR